jgi:O-antigen ligase
MALYPRAMTRWVDTGEGLLPMLKRAFPWAVISTVFFLPISEALKNIAFGVSLGLFLGIIFIGRERIVVPVAGWLFLTFLGAGIVSAVVSPYPEKAITGVWEIFRYTSFFFLVGRGLREERYVKAALWATVISFGFTALITNINYFYHYFAFEGVQHIDAMSLGGIDYAALHSVMMLALIFGIYIHTDGTRGRSIVLIAIASLSIVLLGVTHTRMLWLALIAIGLILAWLRSSRVAVMGMAISVLIVLGLALLDQNVREQVTSDYYKTLRDQGRRVELWVKAIHMWQDAPWLGIGPKTFNLHDDIGHNPQRRKYASLSLPGHAHNLYLQTAVEMGTVGLVILIATFGYVGVWLFRSRGTLASSWAAAAWDGAFGSWMAILFAGVTEPSFGRENAMLFFMLLALVQIEVTRAKESAVAPEGCEA